MKQLFFWKTWPASEKWLASGTLFCLILAFIFLGVKSIDPLANIVQWNVLSELSEVNAIIDTLRIGQWDYGISVPTQLVSEQFVASVMKINEWDARFFWIFAIIGLSVIMASLSTLSRFWHIGASILFIILLASTRPETLHVFGEDSRLLFIIILSLVCGIGYYLQAFKSELGIATRIFIFLGIFIFLSILIGLGASILSPAVTAAAYAMPLWMILTVLFILISATEILAGLVWLSTNGKPTQGRSNILQLIIISLLYLAILLLLYLTNTKRIDWNLTLISPIYLGLIAGIAGIWGFKNRSQVTESILPFKTAGFWLYMGLFIVATSYTAYLASTGNDPLLEVLEDAVVNGQLGMGVLFLFYILINFYEPIQQGLPVHKVLYKPMRFGLTQTRLFGFFGVVLLFSMQNLYPVSQTFAGYFNGLGDVYNKNEEYPLAEQYYKMAVQQDFQNHKSNYALASIAMKLGDANTAAYYFRQATHKKGSPQAYAGLSTILIQENLFFDAIYSLQEGIQRFPKSGELLNNLGMLYAKTNVIDSAYFYLDKAEIYAQKDEVPATNKLTILAKSNDLPLIIESTKTLKEVNYLSWQANWLAIQNLKQNFSKRTLDPKAVPVDSLLSVSSLAYLLNYTLNQSKNDSIPATLLPKLAAKNPTLAEDLIQTSLYSEFYSGNKLKALQMLSSWTNDEDSKSDHYHKILGHWFLQLGLYQKSIDQFSVVKGTEAAVGLAIANAYSDQGIIASAVLDRLKETESEAAIEQLKNTLLDIPKAMGPSDSLSVIAQNSPSEINYSKAIQANPFNASLVAKASDFYTQNKGLEKAYALVLDALRYNDQSGKLWEQYTILSAKQGLLEQADEGEAQVKQFSTTADYQQFLTRYQPIRALVEKQRAEFQ